MLGDDKMLIDMPKNIYIEQAVISGIVFDDGIRRDIFNAQIRNDIFYREVHRILFDTVKKMYENKKTICSISVLQELEKEGVLDDCGGVDYLHKLLKKYLITEKSTLWRYVYTLQNLYWQRVMINKITSIENKLDKLLENK